MSSHLPGVMALERRAPRLFYSVSKLYQESGVTSKVFITVQKHLLKMKMKKAVKSGFLISFPLTLCFKPLGNRYIQE